MKSIFDLVLCTIIYAYCPMQLLYEAIDPSDTSIDKMVKIHSG